MSLWLIAKFTLIYLLASESGEAKDDHHKIEEVTEEHVRIHIRRDSGRSVQKMPEKSLNRRRVAI